MLGKRRAGCDFGIFEGFSRLKRRGEFKLPTRGRRRLFHEDRGLVVVPEFGETLPVRHKTGRFFRAASVPFAGLSELISGSLPPHFKTGRYRGAELLAQSERTRYERGMIQVKLLAFAQAADRLGWREMFAECAPHETLREIVERNAPGFDFTSARVAVDCEYMPWDDAVGPLAQEVAILPPVSGG